MVISLVRKSGDEMGLRMISRRYAITFRVFWRKRSSGINFMYSVGFISRSSVLKQEKFFFFFFFSFFLFFFFSFFFFLFSFFFFLFSLKNSDMSSLKINLSLLIWSIRVKTISW